MHEIQIGVSHDPLGLIFDVDDGRTHTTPMSPEAALAFSFDLLAHPEVQEQICAPKFAIRGMLTILLRSLQRCRKARFQAALAGIQTKQ